MASKTALDSEWIGKLKLVLLGANAVFLATTLAQLPNNQIPYFPGSYGIYVLLTFANLYPMVLILLHRSFRTDPQRSSVNTIFSFMALEWTSTVALMFEAAKSGAFIGDMFSSVLPILIAGLLLLATWRIVIWRIDRTNDSPERLFP